MARLPGPSSALINTIQYMRDPYGTLLRAQRDGEPHNWPTFMGNMVVTGSPAGIETVLSAPANTFDALGAEVLGPVIGESNLILLSGERHRAMRKLQMPPFHGARMKAYGQLILDVAEGHTRNWSSGAIVDAHRTMQEISLEVILKAVLGLGDAEQRARFKASVLALIAALKPSFLFTEALRRPLGGLTAWARFQRRREEVVALFTAEVARRRESGALGEDILSLLMTARYDDGRALTDEELFIQMLNLIVAGHETTASTLAWALQHVHRDERVKARLIEELRGLTEPLEAEAVIKLPYLEAVCSETMRLTPVAPMVGRVTREPFTLLGHVLPPRTQIGIAILQAHRRPDLYPEPEQFRPERFLERTFSPFEFLPFGGGTRRCIGAAFATYEMKLVLAAVLRKHPMRLLDSRPFRVGLRNTTVGPREEIRMVAARAA